MTKGEPFERVTRDRHCPVCGKGDWCLVGDHAAICSRVESRDRRGEAGWLHHLRDKPVVKPKPQPKPARDWRAEAERLAKGLSADKRAGLAGRLGLPAGGLDCFPLLGFLKGNERRPGCYTFPEVDGAGRVVGIACRYADGKAFLPGGLRGLSVPAGFDPAVCEVVFVVEGPTDVAALRAAGLWAVGRPSNVSGVVALGQLLAGVPERGRIVVVGENDEKADQDWPGLTGAGAVAEALAAALLRRPGTRRFPVLWAVTPDGIKDTRAWLTGRTEPWAERGKVLAGKLLARARAAEGPERALRRVLAENAEIRERMAAVEAVMRRISGGGTVPTQEN